ncbi:MAG: hypothetical protein ACK4N5_15195, partial [Myxococcales bacterium]
RRFVADARLDYRQEQEVRRRLEDETRRRDALNEELRAGTRPFREVRGEIRELVEETNNAVLATLNDEQKKSFLATREEDQRETRARMRREFAPVPRPSR